MYEKPQYLTPDGYKRASKNPFKGGSNKSDQKKTDGDSYLRALIGQKKNLVKASELQKESFDKKPSAIQRPQGVRNGVGISEKAARLIALAIKDLLNSK
jgi:hypothetical protein